MSAQIATAENWLMIVKDNVIEDARKEAGGLSFLLCSSTDILGLLANGLTVSPLP